MMKGIRQSRKRPTVQPGQPGPPGQQQPGQYLDPMPPRNQNPLGVDPRTLTFAAPHANNFVPANMNPGGGAANGMHEVFLKHLTEDLNAYKYDMEYCNQQLRDEASLTPQEARTFRLRTLDLGHMIRLCQHRLELVSYDMQTGANTSALLTSLYASPSFTPGSGPGTSSLSVGARSAGNLGHLHQGAASTDAMTPKRRRKPDGTASAASAKRSRTSDVGNMTMEDDEDPEAGAVLQRLGFWKCRLCASIKFLNAGPGRQPSGPCKWPLRDVAKMITHFMEMHNEHTPSERCMELGAALDKNRGPFEYWLRRSHSLDLGDGSIIGECVTNLQRGQLPAVLRKLSRAAANFPEG